MNTQATSKSRVPTSPTAADLTSAPGPTPASTTRVPRIRWARYLSRHTWIIIAVAITVLAAAIAVSLSLA